MTSSRKRKTKMTDYHPLIAKAVAGLEKNTGEARGPVIPIATPAPTTAR